jgi:thiol-disulfide isomerase/thioredoxin
MSITAPGKVVPCGTEEEFKNCLSDHPGGLTLVHFWADWAPACKHMNEVMEELAKQYPYVTFLTVCACDSATLTLRQVALCQVSLRWRQLIA